MSRIIARTTAFKIVYQNEFQKDNYDVIYQNTLEDEHITGEATIDYINNVTKGIIEHSEKIEKIIEQSLKEGWVLKRISKINIAILKVAVYELLYMKDDVPPKSSIDEALKLVEEYGVPEDKSFINGVLAKIYKDICGG